MQRSRLDGRRMRQPTRTGVCVLRLEHQQSGVLVSLRLNPDISQWSLERERQFSDTDAALQAVRDFVQAFLRETAS